MHRILSILLSALLLAGLCLPALAAAGSTDERLARVTQTVKDSLGLDTERYADFRGDVSEQELGVVWSLRWSGDDGASLSVEALEDGTVVGYRRSDGEELFYPVNRSLPTLPKLNAEAAKAAADAFLRRVLDPETESVVLSDSSSARQLNGTVCRFSGTILLNGLPSPLSYSIAVSGSDNTVTSFYRDALATAYLGGVPSARPAVAQSAAAQALKGTLALELVYVTDGEDGGRAVLRYVPKDGKTQYVDAQTGRLVAPDGDMILYGGAANDAGASEEAASASLARGLTQAELEGVEKLEGVLDSSALDRAVRAESAYRLDGYSLAAADYRLIRDGETESVLCTLRYTLPQEDDWISSRSFTVDGRSGTVKSLSSYGRWDETRKPAVSSAEAQRIAEAFLSRFSAHSGEFALYTTDDRTAEGAPAYGFTFARRVNGYFFPENTCVVQIDCVTGAVCGVSEFYTDAVSFDAPEGLISESAALDAWMSTFDVTLAYRVLPKELSRSEPAEARLIDMGYTRFRTLFLSYALEREGYCPGIDAKTGEPVALPRLSGEIAYNDVSGHWAEKQIEILAACGVGYAGGAFRPDKALTQWELTALLASTQGLRADPENASAEERDSVYSIVYRMGALSRGERSDDSPVTRAQLVRCLLDSAGFGGVAKLSGIFTCSFADRASIPAAELGYAALAQGFGLVTNARYDGSAAATRAVAAVMLHRLMEREG